METAVAVAPTQRWHLHYQYHRRSLRNPWGVAVAATAVVALQPSPSPILTHSSAAVMEAAVCRHHCSKLRTPTNCSHVLSNTPKPVAVAVEVMARWPRWLGSAVRISVARETAVAVDTYRVLVERARRHAGIGAIVGRRTGHRRMVRWRLLSVAGLVFHLRQGRGGIEVAQSASGVSSRAAVKKKKPAQMGRVLSVT